MLWNNVLLHNVAELTDVWRDGKKMQRVPESVREGLETGAQNRVLFMANSEIRFVADGPVRVTLSSPQGHGMYAVSYGSYMDGSQYPITGAPLTIELSVNERLLGLDPKCLENDPWSPRVVRIQMPRKEMVIYKVEGENVRPPKPEEMPSLRYLAYGTSITEGGAATMPHLCYAAQATYHLNADLINLGCSGACHCEKAMFDYIAQRDDWDIASFSLSVNMLGKFSVDEFRDRVRYGINTVAAAHPTKPIACNTLYTFSDDLQQQRGEGYEKVKQYRQVLHEEVAASGKPNLHVFEGQDILDIPNGLTQDLVHPSDFGMMRMGQNLAAKLKALLK